jgi:tRNA 2-thiouridine synthesizing protein A
MNQLVISKKFGRVINPNPMTQPTPIHHHIDARGYKCPVPSLRLQTYLRKHPECQGVTIWADDPMARIDIPFMCQTMADIELELVEDAQFISFKIRRNPKESL